MACRYDVRMAVVDLDRPPAWWHRQASDHMTAPEARALAGTNGALVITDDSGAAKILVFPYNCAACYTAAHLEVYVCVCVCIFRECVLVDALGSNTSSLTFVPCTS